MKTEFNITPFFLCAVLFFAAGAAFYYFAETDPFGTAKLSVPQIIFSACIALELAFAVGYPLLSIYRVEICEGALVYTWVFLPRKKKTYLHEIEGYYSVILPSRQAEYMTFYPVSGGRVLPAVSSFLFANSGPFMKETGLTHLGRLTFSWQLYFGKIVIRKRLP